MGLKKFSLWMVAVYGFSFLLYGCQNPPSYTTTGNGSDIVVVSAGEDVKGAEVDTSNTEDNSTGAPEGVEDDEGLIYGCSVESEAEGRCSRSPD